MINEDEFYKMMLANVEEGIYSVSRDRTIKFWNKGAEIITGFTAAEVVGKNCQDNILNHVDRNGCNFCVDGNCPLANTMIDGEKRSASVFLHHKDGHRVKVNIKSMPIYNDDGKIVGSAELFVEDDKKLAPKRTEEIIIKAGDTWKELALHDTLTKLPNRRYIESYLMSRLNEFEMLGIDFGIMFIDIDHFRDFNNSYGHEMGDEVLKVVADSLQNGVSRDDFVGRLGGEEFIVIVRLQTDEQLADVAEHLRILVENSILRKTDVELKVTISIGATLAKSGDTIDCIFKRADELMYKSKEGGRNKVTLG